MKKHTLEYIKGYFEEQGCELLEKEYKGSRIKMKYRCSCGDISKMSFGNFKAGYRCKRCGYKKSREKQKLMLKYIKNYFEEHKCVLLETEYINCKTKMRYICNCKNINKISFSNFQKGRRCKKCGIEKTPGENNHNYNFNLTNEERLLSRNYSEYSTWRTNVYERDDYTCQKCFQKGVHLNAHHIENYSSNKKLRINKNNGITICKSCHKEFHKIYGRKNNTRQQLDEFLLVFQQITQLISS